MYTTYPIVYGHLCRAGVIKIPTAGKLVVLIALEDLHEGNGLPFRTHRLEKLLLGEDLCLSGDDEQIFGGKSGGTALLLMFNLDQ